MFVWFAVFIALPSSVIAEAKRPYPVKVPCLGPAYQIKMYNGAPAFFIDDKPTAAVLAQPQIYWGTEGYPRIDNGELILTDSSASMAYRQNYLGSTKTFQDQFSISATVVLQKTGIGCGASLHACNSGKGKYRWGLYEGENGPIALLAKDNMEDKRNEIRKEAPFDWEMGKPYRLKIQVEGGRITGFVNDEAISGIQDANPLPPGNIVLNTYLYEAGFDDVQVKNISGEILFEEDFSQSRPWEWNGTSLLPITKDYKDVGIHMYTAAGWGGIRGYSGYFLSPEDKYDNTKIDIDFAYRIERDPEALFLPRVYLSPPWWWLEAHPDEATQLQWLNESTTHPYKYASFTSTLWIEEASEFLRQYIRHLNSVSYGKKIIGFTLFNGSGGEWVYSFEPFFFDYSNPNLKAYRQWLRERYTTVETLRKTWGAPTAEFDTATIPTPKDKTQAYDFEFRDPIQAQRITDYMRFHSISVTAAIDKLAKVVKEETDGKKLVFTAYGYICAGGHRDPKFQESGHMDFDGYIQSPYVDCPFSVHSYWHRAAGGVTITVQPVDSASLYGKMPFLEDDTRSHLSADNALNREEGRTHNLQETLNVLKRDFAYYLSKNAGYWYMDFGNGWYYDDRILNLIGQFKTITEKSLDQDRRKNDDIAVIVSDRSYDYLRNSSNLVRELTYRQFNEQLSRIGAPFGSYHLGALDKMPDHKLYIFINAFYLTDKDKKAIENKVKRNHATALWYYAPGYVTDAGLSVQGIEDVTGIKIAKKEYAGCLTAAVLPGSDPFLSALPPNLTWGNSNTVLGPIFYADDEEATTLALLDAQNLHNAKQEAEGSSFHLPGLVYKNMGDWNSVWCGVPNMPAELLRALAKKAGVHMYTSENDAVYANRYMVSVHAAQAGRRVIALPRTMRVTDAFTGTCIAEQADHFAVTLEKGQTGIWLLDWKE